MIDSLLTVNEAAEVLRVHPETVRVWLRNETLRGSKTGRSWRILRSAVAEFAGSPEHREAIGARSSVQPRVSGEGPARIIGVFNQSGGVGKTTLTRDVGYALHAQGFRVLLVDCDPQATLTIFAGMQPESLSTTIYDAVLKKAALPIHNAWGLSLVPASIEWAYAEVELQKISMGREKRLHAALAPYLNRFDFVILDCPPSLGQISYNALFASEELLIPVQAEYKGTMATRYLFDTIREVREFGNPNLEILGIVPTLLGNNTQTRTMYQALVEQLGPHMRVFDPVRRLVAFSDASEQHLPVQLHKPTSREAIEDINRVVNAILGKSVESVGSVS